MPYVRHAGGVLEADTRFLHLLESAFCLSAEPRRVTVWPGWSVSIAAAQALLLKNAHASQVGGVGLFLRISDREHAKLPEFGERADQVEHDALLDRGVEMKALCGGNIDEVGWKPGRKSGPRGDCPTHNKSRVCLPPCETARSWDRSFPQSETAA